MSARRKFSEPANEAKPARRAPAAPPARDTSNPQVGVEAAEAHKGRRAGKRSDPAFRPTTIFVRKETQRKATRLLEDQDTGKDFSDLVEELVANWITEHSHA